MKIKDRIMKPKPAFFSRLSGMGLTVAAIGGVLLAAPVVLPAFMLKLAGYLVVSGGIISAVCQTTVKGEPE